jgi:hypothetical protein
LTIAAKYITYRGMMLTGDLLLWRSHSVIGWLIRLFSKAPVNHASLVLRLNYEGLRDRRFVLEALESGIVLRLLSERLSDYKGEVHWYPLRRKFNRRRPLIRNYALIKVGTPYDFGSLFKQLITRVPSDSKKFFCSEYCFMAYRAAGLPVVSEKAPRPGDLPSLGIFKNPVRIW